jgi:hypothetical protein
MCERSSSSISGLVQEPEQRGIERPLLDEQRLPVHLPDAQENPVPLTCQGEPLARCPELDSAGACDRAW